MKATFLDPGCKSGVLPCARLPNGSTTGLEKNHPRPAKTDESHLSKTDFYGLAITELTTLCCHASCRLLLQDRER